MPRSETRRTSTTPTTAVEGVRRALLAGTLLAIFIAKPSWGQRFWNTAYGPLAYYSSIDGFWLAGFARVYSPIGFEERPEPHRAWVDARAAWSTEGSYAFRLEAHAPAWWEGWRVHASLAARRDNRLGYFGLGNQTAFDADSITAARPYYYRVSRSTASGRLIVQRRLAGPLRVLAGASLTRTDFRELPGESVFRRDFAGGVVDPSADPFDDAALRFGVVADTRDNEIDPHRGIIVEALYAAARRYARATGSVRAWLEPFPRVWVAARVAGERMGGDPPLAAQLTMESSGEPLVAVGGYHSLRGYHDARFIGPGKLLGSIELRYALLWVPTLIELKIGAFYDVGRAFGPGEDFRITTEGLHRSGGGQLAARILRNSLVVLGAGFGSEGWELIFEGGWAF